MSIYNETVEYIKTYGWEGAKLLGAFRVFAETRRASFRTVAKTIIEDIIGPVDASNDSWNIGTKSFRLFADARLIELWEDTTTDVDVIRALRDLQQEAAADEETARRRREIQEIYVGKS